MRGPGSEANQGLRKGDYVYMARIQASMARKPASCIALKMRKGKVYDKRFNETGEGYLPIIACDLCGREIRHTGNVIFGKLTRKGRTRLFKRLTFTHKECYAKHLLPKELTSGETLLVEMDIDSFLQSLHGNFSRQCKGDQTKEA